MFTKPSKLKSYTVNRKTVFLLHKTYTCRFVAPHTRSLTHTQSCKHGAAVAVFVFQKIHSKQIHPREKCSDRTSERTNECSNESKWARMRARNITSRIIIIHSCVGFFFSFRIQNVFFSQRYIAMYASSVRIHDSRARAQLNAIRTFEAIIQRIRRLMPTCVSYSHTNTDTHTCAHTYTASHKTRSAASSYSPVLIDQK